MHTKAGSCLERSLLPSHPEGRHLDLDLHDDGEHDEHDDDDGNDLDLDGCDGALKNV